MAKQRHPPEFAQGVLEKGGLQQPLPTPASRAHNLDTMSWVKRNMELLLLQLRRTALRR